ncbi:hypothetical protein QBC33DRAFT_511813 [Phialemonium atrogriseum]|uniref:Uncharacterized protein n=1 Tax=Phialemonium atrogriseum TaxID=1093897 RepID=A0AAJ0C8P7_9PEZI|nr:uncharacterized protein QBC33DRAFT_511813 [Phialemonium atrogriseum]KAK1771018.1 hypothetical protein QBC33DRAFT_511813 [Phialemonium atrogriseum]
MVREVRMRLHTLLANANCHAEDTMARNDARVRAAVQSKAWLAVEGAAPPAPPARKPSSEGAYASYNGERGRGGAADVARPKSGLRCLASCDGARASSTGLVSPLGPL